MTFRDWQDVEAADPLVLPIRGKQYRILPLGHLDEIRVREDQERIAGGALPTMTNEDFLRATLGDALDQMRADNVPQKAIVHAATVAHTDARQGREAAEQMWEHGPSPEALAVAIKAMKAATAAAAESSTTSPSTAAAASSTKKPASTRPTRSRKPKGSPSAGRKSSPSPSSSPPTSAPSTASA